MMTGRVTATLCPAVTFINLRYRNIGLVPIRAVASRSKGPAGQPPANAASPGRGRRLPRLEEVIGRDSVYELLGGFSKVGPGGPSPCPQPRPRPPGNSHHAKGLTLTGCFAG